jgi:tRNA-specific 2-thiouridylase
MRLAKEKTVYVGMSGGVDSSVSAALLKEQGYKVVGVFIKGWEPFDFVQGKTFDCGWREDRRDAMRVAAKLEIPFLTIDLSREYKENVVDYMIGEYRAGRTPNPDVMCNRTIKFGAFYDRARAAGADFVATGHYARIREKNGAPDQAKFEMLAGADQNKDQSYFLWTLNGDQLAHTLFPIGDLEKPEVRLLAEKFDLATAKKKDSQGLCFVGKLDLKSFLRGYINEKPGELLNEAGQMIGRHDGVLLYTLGERHGFTVFEKTPAEKAQYVLKKDLAAGTITVGERSSLSMAGRREVAINKCNWITGEPAENEDYLARVRYRQPLEKCRLKKGESGDWIVSFNNPQLSAAGQSLVVYNGEICLGGGIIG